MSSEPEEFAPEFFIPEFLLRLSLSARAHPRPNAVALYRHESPPSRQPPNVHVHATRDKRYNPNSAAIKSARVKRTSIMPVSHGKARYRETARSCTLIGGVFYIFLITSAFSAAVGSEGRAIIIISEGGIGARGPAICRRGKM